MRQQKVRIEFIRKLKPDVYLFGFKSTYIAKNARPGQFVHIKVDDKVTILRRPLSIHKINRNTVYILFRVRGRGTTVLSQYKPGDVLDIIGPLGNGFFYKRVNENRQRQILVAGGMGIAPLVFLAEKLGQTKDQRLKTKDIVLLGAKSKRELLAEQEFRRLGFDVHIATDDGSRGFKGTVIELLGKVLLAPKLMSSLFNIYACGPKEMFYEIAKVIKHSRKVNCQVSFEQFMGCGLGICCGCAIETNGGYKKACKDGPVFNLREIC